LLKNYQHRLWQSSPYGWYKVTFDSGETLYVNTLPFYICDNGPSAAINELASEFGLTIEKTLVKAPFPFSDPGGNDARRLLHALLSRSVQNYSQQTWPVGGTC
jgi:hypothetical protein